MDTEDIDIGTLRISPAENKPRKSPHIHYSSAWSMSTSSPSSEMVRSPRQQQLSNFTFPLLRPKNPRRRARDVPRPAPLMLGRPSLSAVRANPRLVNATAVAPIVVSPPATTDVSTLNLIPDVRKPSPEATRKNSRTNRSPEFVGIQLLLKTLEEDPSDDDDDCDDDDSDITDIEDDEQIIDDQDTGSSGFPRVYTTLSHPATLVRLRATDAVMPAITEAHENSDARSISSTVPSTPVSEISPLRRNSNSSTSTVPTSTSGNSFKDDLYQIKSSSQTSFLWGENESDDDIDEYATAALSPPLSSARTGAFSSISSSRCSSIATFFCRGSRPSIPYTTNSRFSIGLDSIADSDLNLDNFPEPMSVYNAEVDDLKKQITWLCSAQRVDMAEMDMPSDEELEDEEESYHAQLSIISRVNSQDSHYPRSDRKLSTDSHMPATTTASNRSRSSSINRYFTRSRKTSLSGQSMFTPRKTSIDYSSAMAPLAAAAPRKFSYDSRALLGSTEPRTPPMISMVAPHPSMLTGPLLNAPPRRRSRRRTASSECIVIEIMNELGPLEKLQVPKEVMAEDDKDDGGPTPKVEKRKSFLTFTGSILGVNGGAPKQAGSGGADPAAARSVKKKASFTGDDQHVDSRSLRIKRSVTDLFKSSASAEKSNDDTKSIRKKASFTDLFRSTEQQSEKASDDAKSLKKKASFASITDIFRNSEQSENRSDTAEAKLIKKKRSFMSDQSLQLHHPASTNDVPPPPLPPKSPMDVMSNAAGRRPLAIDQANYSRPFNRPPLFLSDIEIPPMDHEWGDLLAEAF